MLGYFFNMVLVLFHDEYWQESWLYKKKKAILKKKNIATQHWLEACRDVHASQVHMFLVCVTFIVNWTENDLARAIRCAMGQNKDLVLSEVIKVTYRSILYTLPWTFSCSASCLI